MKTLIIVSHPEIDNSQTQQFLKKGSEEVDTTWHHIESLDKIDVLAEQKLLKNADRIIFQFPLYWYAAPFGLKKWEDEVLTRNFIYGDGTYPLKDKEFGLVVTTGMPLKDFQHGAKENITLDEAMAPYRAIAHLGKMKILTVFSVPQFWYMDEDRQMQLLIDYERYLSQKMPDSLLNREEWFNDRLNKFVSKLDDGDKFTGNLILDTFTNNKEDLSQLNDTLKMIKNGEE
ncbi:NAD(P)H-dependent oxidoreductase [Companilactobacillus allii]|uniref:NADPH:quinone reductase n=1 Tax=Companilactobacillus allii TaxID=1847728 RepID=A0A1P8Q5S6_9LACO|nr:NAD(P)H-dependent oxidoreductase [Companilactobacillus allii]APX73192.1 NADPH:quinone reductase [Companilactobacillus allii]USQ69891.1 NAD(P)H-dependent oxidoreductase [Companilactobacillus allii]